MITIKSILLALCVAAIFAFSGMYILSDEVATYTLPAPGNETAYYVAIQEESTQISENMNKTNAWLQDLTSGSVIDFAFAVPDNIANILSTFTKIPNFMYSVFSSTLAVFGIPPFITGIFSVMMIIVVLLIIVAIWTKGVV